MELSLTLHLPTFSVKVLMSNHLKDLVLYLTVSNPNSPVTWDVKPLSHVIACYVFFFAGFSFIIFGQFLIMSFSVEFCLKLVYVTC